MNFPNNIKHQQIDEKLTFQRATFEEPSMSLCIIQSISLLDKKHWKYIFPNIDDNKNTFFIRWLAFLSISSIFEAGKYKKSSDLLLFGMHHMKTNHADYDLLKTNDALDQHFLMFAPSITSLKHKIYSNGV